MLYSIITVMLHLLIHKIISLRLDHHHLLHLLVKICQNYIMVIQFYAVEKSLLESGTFFFLKNRFIFIIRFIQKQS